jgi:hypothetical protein
MAAVHRPPGSPHRSPLLFATGCFIALQPLIVLIESIAMVGIAAALYAVNSSSVLSALTRFGPGDAAYKGIGLSALTRTRPTGLTVTAPLGDWLSVQMPAVFLPPAGFRTDSWMSAVVAEGSTLLAELVVHLSGQFSVLAIGLAMLVTGRSAQKAKGLPAWPSMLGAFLLLEGAAGLGRTLLGVSPHDLEVIGLAHFAHLFSYRLNWIAPEHAMSVTWVTASCFVGGAIALLLGLAWSFNRRLISRATVIVPLMEWKRSTTGTWVLAQTASAIISIAVIAMSPSALAKSTPAHLLGQVGASNAESQPTIVTINGEPFDYQYLVNGVPQVVRSICYNAVYQSQGREWRAPRYDRDFALIRSVGFNTVLGWDEQEFDELTLDKAHEYGLGVVFPYHFPYDGDFENSGYRAEQIENVLRYVRRYARHPAIRMWGLGNETVWGIGGPGAARAQAFGTLLADVAEQVHLIDPNHPILYRDSEDLYIQPVRDALRARSIEQPWFVYGANVYTFRLGELITNWPDAGFRVPLFISEYSPTGFSATDRPSALVEMARTVERQPQYVLGGSIYAWTTRSNDVVDRVYGLVDESGLPVDGSLEALRRAYRD